MFIIAIAIAAAATAGAQQQPAPPAAPPKTIIGTVRDENGAPVDSVDILIASLRKRVRTDAAGRFRFTDIEPGKYLLGARRIGFLPQLHNVVVTQEAGATASLGMVANVNLLAPKVTSASAGGLFGVIGDTTYQALANVEVRAVATDKVTRTDSLGAFHLDLKPGTYTVTIRKDSFATQMLAVRIPKDSGRRMMMWMVPQAQRPVREMMQFQEMNIRRIKMSAVWDKVYSRDEIAESKVTDLRDLVGRTIHGNINEMNAYIDGGPRTLPLWAIDPGDVEMIEVYGSPPQRQRTVSLIGGRRAENPSTRPAGIYVWLRK